LIVGGWGGSVVGLSSIDGRDASDNQTTNVIAFKNKQWYHIRLRVTLEKITAWIDGRPITDQELAGHRLSIRPEVELSKPLGFSTWRTQAGLRNLRYRLLSDAAPNQEMKMGSCCSRGR
jgi:hypothetical protein